MFAISALLVVTTSVTLEQVSLGTAVAILVANQIGGIAPDFDHPAAPVWRNLPLFGWLGRFVSKMLGGHRFLTHSIVGLALFGLGARWLLALLQPIMPTIDTNLVWWGFMIGMVSHLLIDTISKEGVPWLLPVPIKFGFLPVRKLRVTTGENVELWGIIPALIIFNIYWFATHYQTFRAIIHQF